MPLFCIFFDASQTQWNPIAPSNHQKICWKINYNNFREPLQNRFLIVRKSFFSVFLAFFCLFCGVQASADVPQTRDIDVSVVVNRDGSADICEVWDVCVTEGTEMYLVRYNLGSMDITGFSVCDETGRVFDNIGRWDVDASRSSKAGKCGAVSKNGGYELCWGFGSYGDHIFTITYRMTNAVQAFNDYDAMHIQFVSPGIRPRPQNVSVRVSSRDHQLDSLNCAAWGFGFNGTLEFTNGDILARSTEPFSSDQYSVILLTRFDKGMFTPSVALGEPFQNRLDKAFEGSAYQDYLNENQSGGDRLLPEIIATLFAVLAAWSITASVKNRNNKIFGVKRLKDIGYERDIPFGGNLFESLHVLRRGTNFTSSNTIASAIILRMIYNGQLIVNSADRKKIEISFNESPSLEKLSSPERKLFNMMKAASGSDMILQNREFSRWAKRHTEEVTEWCNDVEMKGRNDLRTDGLVTGNRFTDEGQANARKVIGLRKFLKDFTLVKERAVPEVALWQEYLVFASLYGIADKVAEQLKDIDPQKFEEVVGYDPFVMNRILYLSNNMAGAITNSVVSGVQTAGSVGGHGGFTSFGGGGGFGGGGFGGGAR